jgi:SpoU rRNA methylase family enzyme
MDDWNSDEPNDDLFLDDDDLADLAEDIEPQVWLLTVYPEPGERWVDPERDIEGMLLTIFEVKDVSLKRVSK